nr:TonB-dependent receptor [Saprospiraceae bacterium]
MISFKNAQVKALILTLLGLLCSYGVSGQVVFKGVVTDENRSTLPGATVCTYPDTICGITDDRGVYELTHRRMPQRLEVRYVGFKTLVIDIDPFQPEDHYHIVLQSVAEDLGEVIIEEDRLRRDVFQSVTVVGDEFFQKHSAGNFSSALSNLPGINHLSVGVGVGKPVIRGLFANRVIVSDHGVKQESHQWGTDHGLEIDQFRAGKVEIIKGPSSLEHGSDGLGGMLRIRPDPIPEKNSVAGSVKMLGKSNNNHLGGNIYLAGSGEKFFASGNLSGQSFADYRVPADRFIYNSFELPIINERLKNTAGNERSMGLTAGYRDDHHLLRIFYSNYKQEAGIFAGAVGIPRSFLLQDDGDDRNIEFPSQEVTHQKWILQYLYSVGEKRTFEFTAGFQDNLRREFSFPEFHAIPDRNINLRKALELHLQTVSFSASYGKESSYKLGVNVQHQHNSIGGFDYFLPPFEVFRAGAFATKEWHFGEYFKFTGGLRLDFGDNQTEAAGRMVWNTSGEVIDSLVSGKTDNQFFNWAASTGFVQTFSSNKHLELYGHLGKSFRIPYPVETSANGVHHGTFRHEMGRPDLKSEHGYQFDLGIRYFESNWYASVTPFLNYFNNYIYLRPSAVFSSLPDAGQLYLYEQHNVVFSGVEVEWQYQISPKLAVYQAFDGVWNYNIDTQLPLPFSPPASVLTNVNYLHTIGKSLVEVGWELSHRFKFTQKRVDRNERPTPSHHLIHLGLNLHFPGLWDGITLNFQCQNIFDTHYFEHLSRYRQLDIPEQGRNFILQVQIPFRTFL